MRFFVALLKPCEHSRNSRSFNYAIVPNSEEVWLSGKGAAGLGLWVQGHGHQLGCYQQFSSLDTFFELANWSALLLVGIMLDNGIVMFICISCFIIYFHWSQEVDNQDKYLLIS